MYRLVHASDISVLNSDIFGRKTPHKFTTTACMAFCFFASLFESCISVLYFRCLNIKIISFNTFIELIKIIQLFLYNLNFIFIL